MSAGLAKPRQLLPKPLLFGFIGALGCLFGWAAGEGLLAARPKADATSKSEQPSILASPQPPALPPGPESRMASSAPAPPLEAKDKTVELAPAPPPALTTARKIDAAPPPPEFAERLKREGAKTGDVQISLIWHNYNDLDLHCIDPNGEHIWYSQRKSRSGGELDVDMNVQARHSRQPVENIYWPAGGAPPGKYKVYVHHFKNHRQVDPTPFQVSILVQGKRKEFKGSLSYGQQSRVEEFEVVPEPELRLAAPPSLKVEQDSRRPFQIRIARVKTNETATVRFAGLPTGVRIDSVTLAADQTTASAEVQADLAAPTGQHAIQVTASAGSMQVEARMNLVIERPTPALQMALSPQVTVEQGGKSRFQLRLGRYHAPGPVKVQFTGLPNGAQIAPLQLAADQSEATSELEAALTAPAGKYTVRATASGGPGQAVKTEAALSLIVQRVYPGIRLAAAPTLTTDQGGMAKLQVRLARDYFEGPVTLHFDDLPSGVTAEQAVAPVGQDTVELTIVAKEDTSLGAYPLKLQAKAEAVRSELPIQLTIQVPPPPAKSIWSWQKVLEAGLWTALLAIGLTLALALGQNRYLGRPLLTGLRLPILVGGGFLVGLLAGGVGQALLSALAQWNMMPQIGFLAGWMLLGGLVGRGVGLFIPNLAGLKAALAGAAGGLLGAGAFLLAAQVGGDLTGRLVGAGLLGFAVGLMVAWAERAFRQAWLEVYYGGGELRSVNLGPEPVSIGSNAQLCTIYARDAAPVAYRFRIAQGQILREDATTGKVQPVRPGEEQPIGAVRAICRTSNAAKTAGPQQLPAIKPPPPPPVVRPTAGPPRPGVRPPPPPPPPRKV